MKKSDYQEEVYLPTHRLNDVVSIEYIGSFDGTPEKEK